MAPFKHQGRDIFWYNDLVAETKAKSTSLDSGSQAVGLAGRIVALLNAADGIILDEAVKRLANQQDVGDGAVHLPDLR